MKIFYICSWGGTGSTMLCKYLSQFGKTYHIHSRYPPINLSDIFTDTHYKINHCCWFNDKKIISDDKINDYYVIFLYRNPVNCILSRFIKNNYCNYKKHLKHIGCDQNIEIHDLKKTNEDLYKLNEFYDNYFNKNKNRNYNIYCVKYEDFFKNVKVFNYTFGIYCNKNQYPKKIVKPKNEINTQFLHNIYKELNDKMNKNKFITIIPKKIDKFSIITTIHNDMSDSRLDETIFCIKNNLKNDLFDKIIIFLEIKAHDTEIHIDNHKINKKLLELFKNDNISYELLNKRPTYKTFFEYCNNFKNKKWILCNSDIYFPVWNKDKLKLLLHQNYNEKCFVLTRYNILDELPEHIIKNQMGVVFKHNNIVLRTQHLVGNSIDSWIFKTPFPLGKLNLDIEIGRPECDGMMNYELSKVKTVLNPCLSIISIHKHSGWSPESYDRIFFENKIYTRKEYNNLMLKRGHHKKNINFCNL